MSVTQDKLLLLKSHACSRGLSEEALQEISAAAEIVHYDTGDYLHRADQTINSVFLIVHGRLKQAVVDMHGQILFHRFLTRGSQFGALAAAQVDSVPVEVLAVEPAVALKLDFETALRFTREYETFGLNITRSISDMVARVLLSERRPKKAPIVAVFHESPHSRALTRRLMQRLLTLGESPCLMSDQTERTPLENVPYRALIEDDQFLTREAIRRQINQWSESQRIFLDVDASLSPSQAIVLAEFSEQVLWCTSHEFVETSVSRLQALQVQAPGRRDKINLVWMLNGQEPVAPRAAALDALVSRDFKISPPTPGAQQSYALANGLERLVHQLRGVRIGLALGGGGARGLAHLGVLQVLEENGIVVDMIAGTSAGAMTGILYAAGHEADYLTQSFAEDLTPGWFFRMLPHGKDLYLLYKYRRGHFEWMLRRYLQDWSLAQLPLPVQSVTVDLVSGQPVVRAQADATDSILESINLPVLSRPINRDGQALVDGGLVNNIPADVLVKSGCNFVIAVSVTAHLKSEFAKNQPDTPTAEMSTASTLQTVLRSYLVQNVNMNSVGVQPADVVIEPNVTRFDLTEFSRAHALAQAGKLATRQDTPKIQNLLHQLDAELFPALPRGPKT